MRTKQNKIKYGFTLTELMVTIVMSVIVIFGVAILMVDSQRGWRLMYQRVHGQVVNDTYVAGGTFDSVCRKASIKQELVSPDRSSLEVYYYSDPLNLPDETEPDPDRYAKFSAAGGSLSVTHGSIVVPNVFDEDAGILTHTGDSSTVTLATNVTAGSFSAAGISVQMVLTINDGRQSLTTTTSAQRHN